MKPPCPPKSECWCIEHPNNPECVPAFEITNEILIITILMLIIWKTKKSLTNGLERQVIYILPIMNKCATLTKESNENNFFNAINGSNGSNNVSIG